MAFKDAFVGKKILQPFFKKLHTISLRGMNYGMGAYVNQSGEEWVLKKLGKVFAGKDLVVFDVGANSGEYALAVNQYLPQAEIFAFEPSRYTFDLLASNIKATAIRTFQLGLSNETKSSKLYFERQTSGLASVYPIYYDFLNVSLVHNENIQLVTLDGFCAKHGITKIDFLKIDVEGHEYEVLEGAKKLIAAHSIPLIQFEFGVAMMESKRFLKDFKALLSEYTIYRILQDGIEPIIYDEKTEIFLTTNYLAILKTYKSF